jgi:hypothetical protein
VLKDDRKPRVLLALADLSAIHCLGYPINHDRAFRTARGQ